MEKQEFAVGWFTLSLVIAGIAQGKGRSGLAWWLLGVLLGPIALLILLFLNHGDAGGLEDRLGARLAEEVRRLDRAGSGPR
jgi:hypothetical protein